MNAERLPSASAGSVAETIADAAMGAGRRGFRLALLTAWIVVWMAMMAWCSLALWYAPFGGPLLRVGLVVALLAAGLVGIIQRARWRRVAIPVACWTAVIVWFWNVPAPNDRQWQSDVRVAPRIERQGDRIVVRSVRDFRYQNETDFDERWEERSYDLSKVRTLDVFMSYWGPSLICHTFVSFGFERDDGTMEQVCVSIETRKAEGQAYSAVAGAFRQFTLVHVWGDERDIVWLRTAHRREDVYRYRLAADEEGVRRLLLSYVDRANALAEHPEWYNAVTHSCGVGIVRLAWHDEMQLIPPLRVAFNGLWDQYAYDQGVLGGAGETFAAVRQAAYINDLAREATEADFSARIRGRSIRLKEQAFPAPGGE